MPKRTYLFLLSVFAVVSTLGCSTVETNKPVNQALTSIFSAVEKAMSMGIHHYSTNHREFYSRPFLVKQDDAVAKAGYRQRGLAKVTVLGDSRPYNIEVEVDIQRATVKKPINELSETDYTHERYDKRLAEKLLNSILSIMEKRERDQNLIDDFKPF